MPSRVISGYKFFFYSNERNEPPHMHVRKGGNETKIWLDSLVFANNFGFDEPELNRILRVTRSNLDELFDFWNNHFPG